MTTQSILESQLSSQEDLNRVPHPSHRHAAPSAPWPWIDLADGLFFFGYTCLRHQSFCTNDELKGVDQEQLACVAPPIPEICDHSPEKCNSCWKGYPQSRFPNWTRKQVEKAKIYKLIHNYSKSNPCICYRVDVNDRGFFTNTKEITATYGEEDKLWDDLIHEQVSFSFIICGAFLHEIFL